MAPERTIHAESAISQRTKRDTLFAEGMRHLSALDQYTTAVDRNEVLDAFLNGLRVYGYGHPMRQDILVGILVQDAELRRTER